MKPINPAPPNVLPFKRFSLSVWKWIAREAKIYKQKPSQICERIRDDFGITMSENTVRNCVNEIDAFLSGQIDQRTLLLMKEQKKIVLALDGQKPDTEGNALWLFVDLISNRVLKIELLKTADHLTLRSIVDAILKRFEVALVGIVSDKQDSIRKMRDEFYPNVPHQYCHFHFLQNLWNHIEVKDGNLHKKLVKLVNHLYILSVAKSTKSYFEGLGKVSVRDVFSEVERDLRAIIKAGTKKFDFFRGIDVYKRLKAYVGEMERLLAREDLTRRIVKLMNSTATFLRQGIDALEPCYYACVELNEMFQSIRKLLGTNPEIKEGEKIDIAALKAKKLERLDRHFETIWETVKGFEGVENKEHLKSFQPQKDTAPQKIKQEWVRLYNSYREGLYAYHDLPIEAKTNSAMESKFSEEKSRFISRVGKVKVGAQIRIRGEHVLKQLYAGKEEISAIIEEMEGSYDKEQIKEGLKALARRTKEEIQRWRNRICELTSVSLVLKKGKDPQKRENRTKKENFVGED